MTIQTRTGNKLTRKEIDSDSDSDDDSYVEDDESIGSEDSDTEDDEDDSADDEGIVNLLKKKYKDTRKQQDEYDDSDEEEISQEEIRKELSKMYPSQYINSKVKRDDERSKGTKQSAFDKLKYKPNSGRADKNTKNKPKDHDNKKRNRKMKEEYIESSEEDCDDDDKIAKLQEKLGGKGINIVFGFGGAETEDEDEELPDDNEECDSDDEKMFLKENYQVAEVPDDIKKEEEKTNSKDNSNKKKNKKKKTVVDDEVDVSDKFESEYMDLLDMRKMFIAKLKKHPDSISLKKGLHNCRRDMKKLIKQTRSSNTKGYHKLVSSQKPKLSGEIDYFKKKLSHKEQLKVMSDLKEINNHIQVDKPYRLQLLESDIPTKYKANVMQKVNMLKSMDPGDPEYYKVKNWVDDFMRVPFGKYTGLDVNMTHGLDVCNKFMEDAMQILDDCAYGLTDAKMQILQLVGQWIANPSAMGTAIAIKGPMGTGKTTLVKEGISKILKRFFAFIPLGGCGDGSFLEGHSYTYEGSKHGKIVQVLKDSGCMNPVFYFDELDKVSDTPRGEEIIGILTHLTDSSQNNEFHDKYFSDVDFDLSKSLFIFSYNDESRVNPILKDRMYCIETKGYDAKEKIVITKDYLLPKIREQVGFTKDDVIIPDDTIEYIVNNKGITMEEAGVRNLKRCLEVIHTKLNLFRLVKMDKDNMFSREIKMTVEFPFTVTKEDVDKLIKSDMKQSQSVLSMYT
jgi:ATP-dependent Lon protease